MKSIAHKEMNSLGNRLYPDGLVPWRDPKPPETTGHTRTGHLRACSYCGSMHPEDVANAIRAGATGEWADRKYGWTHKAYFEGVPNPHAGLLEVRGSANFKPEGREDWVQSGSHWHEPPKPAPEKTRGKFYTVHLQDATPEDRETIETHLGIRFEFHSDGGVSWKPTSA